MTVTERKGVEVAAAIVADCPTLYFEIAGGEKP
jgi:hypothetical protein